MYVASAYTGLFIVVTFEACLRSCTSVEREGRERNVGKEKWMEKLREAERSIILRNKAEVITVVKSIAGLSFPFHGTFQHN